MLNCAIIMGRLTADPELRQTTSGVAVTKFNVAVDRRYNKGEDKQTDFLSVVAWRQTAEFVCKYFTKGSMIALQGEIQTGSYEKDGTTVRTFDIVADNVSFCGGKEQKPTNEITEKTTNSNIAIENDEDLPF